ncbi:MAG: glutamate--tRNA ligase family protein [Planctomycetota bacterium]
MTKCVSRLAPSPTGALHLGNVRTFFANWALARGRGWTLAMRIEDLDGPRVRPGAAAHTLETLAWLGLDFDGTPMYQSADLEPYRDAMRRLAAERLTYACRLTRAQISQASTAPHAGEHELRFPPDLRPAEIRADQFDDESANYRLVVEPDWIVVEDRVAGSTRLSPAEEVGDFVVWTKRGTPSYQLAVVVDDLRQEVTDVVRGRDLLPSAARQELLYRALGHATPRWWHLPLVLGPDGRRLAKRHGDTRIDTYRRAGVPPPRIIGLLGYWSGLADQRVEMSASDFLDAFSIGTLPQDPVTFTEKDHAWLLGRT